ncbi:hypothetical protein [Sphingomonas sp.]|uniref:hypothetical protein n=1 Tax=Sphingomonas sp. TaxID=28214 RepID=UPI0017E7A235|nr:hypothetical protein [Sphingomonas sp.]MBA3511184.1 hypothetical protein [Sphingomonas sp.]
MDLDSVTSPRLGHFAVEVGEHDRAVGLQPPHHFRDALQAAIGERACLQDRENNRLFHARELICSR